MRRERDEMKKELIGKLHKLAYECIDKNFTLHCCLCERIIDYLHQGKYKSEITNENIFRIQEQLYEEIDFTIRMMRNNCSPERFGNIIREIENIVDP